MFSGIYILMFSLGNLYELIVFENIDFTVFVKIQVVDGKVLRDKGLDVQEKQLENQVVVFFLEDLLIRCLKIIIYIFVLFKY